MPRSSKPAVAPPEQPHVIKRAAVYTPAQARHFLGLRRTSLAREIREKRLSVVKRAGKYYFLGRQLLAWLDGGEIAADVCCQPRASIPTSRQTNGTV
jgi:hypothetical protein